MNVLSRLLPDATNVRLETWSLEPASSIITLTLRARRITTARCPLCGRRSKRVHSRHERTLADLPWGECAVVVPDRREFGGARPRGGILGPVFPSR